MTEEDFLTRWSRRKRQSADVGKPPAEPAPRDAEFPQQTGPIAAPTEPFDPATLPPIDSITALSDISAFLQKGVPPELTRAALRRVWTADPAIRDFVGLAENAWDFTDPNAMPGFGPLELNDEVRRMIAGIVDKIGTLPLGDPQIQPMFARAADIYLSELPTIPITQAKKLIPFDTTHWTGWPTHDNNYIQATTWWQMTPIILQNIHSTGR